MIDPISTGALIGAGWAGKKILGPSFDEIGGHLKIYVGDRIRKIFQKVETADRDAKLNTLPPAYALKFFQAASLSEDDDLITNMWANLLLNASEGFSHRKVLYLDILEKLSAEDARLLNELIDEKTVENGPEFISYFLSNIKTSVQWNAERILREREIAQFDFEAAEALNDFLADFRAGLPVRILTSNVPYTPEMPANSSANAILPSGASVGLASSTGPYDPLIRQRLIQEFDFDFTVGFEIGVEGIMATSLGIEFVRNCRGYL